MTEEKENFDEEELRTLSDLLSLPYQDLTALAQKHGAYKFLSDLRKLALQKDRQRSKLVLKPISDLLKYHFFVDNYQRGFKWNPQQVQDLLEDIEGFHPEQEGDFYCLQPLVVKYHDDKGYWELIDGQQRITTIYLILTYLEKEAFKIVYETRPGSSEFLEKIMAFGIDVNEQWENFIKRVGNTFDNVDNYHFFLAWNNINEWFDDKTAPERDAWLKTLLYQTKVIWYDAVEKDSDKLKPIDIFMRLNSGKIPLTNAELIKALILHNPGQEQEDQVKNIRRIETSKEWDSMEQSLQNDEFWFFINKRARRVSMPNRIEFLFDIIANKPESSDNDFFTFKYFSDRAATIAQEWKRVRDCFSQLQEWFNDDNKYHLIGYTVNRNIESIPKLLNMAETFTKSALIEELENIIREKMRSYDLNEYNYEENKNELVNVLLLFNIETMRQSGSAFRFPFGRYVKETWSLEHIHAQNSQPLGDQERVAAWYQETKDLFSKIESVPDKVKDDLENWWSIASKTSSEAKTLLEGIQKQLYELFGDDDENDGMHTIDNLALLGKDTNSSLNNEIFPIKRLRIIESDSRGKFIPIATKNVFLKYYSKDVSQMNLWSKNDRQMYKSEIQRVLKKYLPEAK